MVVRHVLSLFAIVAASYGCVQSLAGYGLDFIDPISQSTVNCFSSGSYFTSTRVFEDIDGGVCDPNAGNTIHLTTSSGVTMMPYIFPDPPSWTNGGNAPGVQVDIGLYCGIMNGMANGALYMLDIEVDPSAPWPSCSQSLDAIFEMIVTLWKYSEYAGVYSSAYEWGQITCQSDADSDSVREFEERLHKAAEELSREPLAKVTRHPKNASRVVTVNERTGETRKEHNSDGRTWQAQQPIVARAGPTRMTRFGNRNGAAGKATLLWYADWDGEANFNSFTPFGPFKSPFAKQYNDGGNICGVPCDLDWTPL